MAGSFQAHLIFFFPRSEGVTCVEDTRAPLSLQPTFYAPWSLVTGPGHWSWSLVQGHGH